jgi:hypothetical protein
MIIPCWATEGDEVQIHWRVKATGAIVITTHTCPPKAVCDARAGESFDGPTTAAVLNSTNPQPPIT